MHGLHTHVGASARSARLSHYVRGWRTTVGSLIVLAWLKEAYLSSVKGCWYFNAEIQSTILCKLSCRSEAVNIHQRGVQWKQGVVICMVLCTSLPYNTTPIHCTPLPLHPPVMNTQAARPAEGDVHRPSSLVYYSIRGYARLYYTIL